MQHLENMQHLHDGIHGEVLDSVFVGIVQSHKAVDNLQATLL